MSIGLSTKLYGFWIPNRKLFGNRIDRIRHVVTPTVSFSYAPDFGASRYGYWDTYQKTDADGNVSLVSYSPYQNALYGVPGKGKSGNISFTIGNNLEMKWRDKNDSLKKVSLIDAFDVSMSYNTAAKVRPWSDMNNGFGWDRLPSMVFLSTPLISILAMSASLYFFSSIFYSFCCCLYSSPNNPLISWSKSESIRWVLLKISYSCSAFFLATHGNSPLRTLPFLASTAHRP